MVQIFTLPGLAKPNRALQADFFSIFSEIKSYFSKIKRPHCLFIYLGLTICKRIWFFDLCRQLAVLFDSSMDSLFTIVMWLWQKKKQITKTEWNPFCCWRLSLSVEKVWIRFFISSGFISRKVNWDKHVRSTNEKNGLGFPVQKHALPTVQM